MFDQKNFAPISSHAAPSPSLYSYLTADTLPEVKAVGYFDKKRHQLKAGDLIMGMVDGILYKLIVVGTAGTVETSRTVTKTVTTKDTDTGTYTLNTGLLVDIGLEVTIVIESALVEDLQVDINLPSVLGGNNNSTLHLALFVNDVQVNEAFTIVGNTLKTVSITMHRPRGEPDIAGDLVVKVQAADINGAITLDNEPLSGGMASITVTQSIDVEI